MPMFCSIARNESDLVYFSKDLPSRNSKTVLLPKPKKLWVSRLALPTLVQLRTLYSLDLTEPFLILMLLFRMKKMQMYQPPDRKNLQNEFLQDGLQNVGLISRKRD